MDDKQFKLLLGRIEQLEQTVSDLMTSRPPDKVDTKTLHAPSDQNLPSEKPLASQTPTVPVIPAQFRPPPSRLKPKHKLPDNMRTGEYWLNKFGIGLILFGVAFGFKYSVDQGWLTPTIRIIMGLLLGGGLFGIGWRVNKDRKRFSHVLYGGAIADLYITGFAAFQLFGLVPHTVAFAFMLLVTIVALLISIRQNSSMLALIGTVGGLGTPFLLYTEAGNLPGLVTYTSLLLAAIGIIYLYKGWRAVLSVSIFGGLAVFMIGIYGSLPDSYLEGMRDRWALQAGLLFFWLLFWIVPVLREMLWKKSPTTWPLAPLGFNAQKLPADFRRLVNSQAFILPVMIPLVAFANSTAIWNMADKSWGWVAFGVAMIYGMATLYLNRDRDFNNLRYVHLLAGTLFLTLALTLLLEGNSLFIALVSEATILHLTANRLSNRSLSFGGHLLFGYCFLWLMFRLLDSSNADTVILNIPAAVNIFPILLAAYLAWVAKSTNFRMVYFLAAHVCFLLWLGHEFSPLANGHGFITLSWVAYGVILVVIGLRNNMNRLRTVALITLLLAVLKLFIIDLAQVKAIWRVLMSVGIGGLFLFLSYFFRHLWRNDDQNQSNGDSKTGNVNNT